jgi:hypothetical protein
MKNLVIALILLIPASVTWAAHNTALDPAQPEFSDQVKMAMVQGAETDPAIYRQYLYLTLTQGSELEKEQAAGKMAECYLLWNKIHASGVAQQMPNIDTFQYGMFRSYSIFNLLMTPMIKNTPKLFGKVLDLLTAPLLPSLIRNCNALDIGIQSVLQLLQQPKNDTPDESVPSWIDPDKQRMS